MVNTRTIVLIALAFVGSGCLRQRFDRCAEVPPHPDCIDSGPSDSGVTEAGPLDAGAAPDADDAGLATDSGPGPDATS